MRTICYVTLSPVLQDKRSLNQLKLLENMGYSGILITLWHSGLSKEEKLYSTRIIRINAKHPKDGFRNYAVFNFLVYRHLKNLSFDLLHIHELWALAGSIMAVKKRNIPVIYDTHEYFQSIDIYPPKKPDKRIWYLIERIFTPYTNALIAVSEPHRRIYQMVFRHFISKDTMVIYNVPEKIPEFRFKLSSQIHVPEKLILYNDLSHHMDLLLPLIKSMRYIKENIVLVICSYKSSGNPLLPIIRELELENKILFYQDPARDEVLSLAARALAGIILYESSSINNRYAMPDIFFEYIQTETPMILSNLATFRSIADNYDMGILINQITPESIGSAIQQILLPDQQELYRKNLKMAKEVFIWDMEKEKLARLYKKLLSEKK